MDQPPLPPAFPSAIPVKKGLSTGCIISIIVAVIFVPIVIIAVLAGMAVPAGNMVMRKARILQARANSQGLVIAVKGFQTEYDRLPLPRDQVVLKSPTIPASGPVLDALLATDTDINPRGVKFYDPPLAKNNTNGLLEKDGKRTMLDPWGHVYSILFDFDGDGKIPDPEHPGAMLDTTTGVFSAGPDGDSATWQDNVKSWAKEAR